MSVQPQHPNHRTHSNGTHAPNANNFVGNVAQHIYGKRFGLSHVQLARASFVFQAGFPSYLFLQAAAPSLCQLSRSMPSCLPIPRRAQEGWKGASQVLGGDLLPLQCLHVLSLKKKRFGLHGQRCGKRPTHQLPRLTTRRTGAVVLALRPHDLPSAPGMHCANLGEHFLFRCLRSTDRFLSSCFKAEELGHIVQPNMSNKRPSLPATTSS